MTLLAAAQGIIAWFQKRKIQTVAINSFEQASSQVTLPFCVGSGYQNLLTHQQWIGRPCDPGGPQKRGRKKKTAKNACHFVLRLQIKVRKAILL
jgi:hypothetical protein